MGKDVWFYSITLQPEIDTSDRLRAYAERFGVGPGWLFLTGKPDDIYRIRQNLGYWYPTDPAKDADMNRHIGLLLMGNEPYDWWGTAPAGSMHPNQLSNLVRWLEPGAKSRTQ